MERAEEKITDAELTVMQVLWQAGEPLTMAQIKAALPGHNGDTTKTLLRRLCRKGAVEQEKREVYSSAMIDCSDMTLTEYHNDGLKVYDINEILRRWENVPDLIIEIRQRVPLPSIEG